MLRAVDGMLSQSHFVPIVGVISGVGVTLIGLAIVLASYTSLVDRQAFNRIRQ